MDNLTARQRELYAAVRAMATTTTEQLLMLSTAAVRIGCSSADIRAVQDALAAWTPLGDGFDPRPSYSASDAIGLVQKGLAAAGIVRVVPPARLRVAIEAAANLLRALDIQPLTGDEARSARDARHPR